MSEDPVSTLTLDAGLPIAGAVRYGGLIAGVAAAPVLRQTPEVPPAAALAVGLGFGLLAAAGKIALSVRRVHFDGRRVYLTRRIGASEAIDIDRLVELGMAGSTLRLTSAYGRTVKLAGLDPDQAARLLRGLIRTGDFHLAEARAEESVYRAAAEVTDRAVEARKTLRCPACKETYPSTHWFEDPRGRRLETCFPCHERRPPTLPAPPVVL